jgi:thiol-disulfide isomerase/thioredoxin
MQESNSRITSLAARLVEPNESNRSRCDLEDDKDDEAIFAELEEEIENNGNSFMREHTLQVLKREMESVKQMKQNEHGKYTEITDEKEVVRVSAHEPRCVIHFYHSKFKRCEIMDKHLAKLAPKYFNTRFLKVFVENIPWLVEKLSIKVLPCVICFIDGVSKDRLVGFEELGNNDAFDTAVLELRLSSCGVIKKSSSSTTRPLFQVSHSRQNKGDEEDFDL